MMGTGTPWRVRTARKVWEESGATFGPNMTPMVDIVMVILIFFMAGTALVGREFFLSPALPTPAGQGTGEGDPYTLPPAEFTIDLQADELGVVRPRGLGLGTLEMDEMLAALRRLALQAPVSHMTILVRSTPEVPYQDVVTILDGCTEAGFQRVGLIEK